MNSVVPVERNGRHFQIAATLAVLSSTVSLCAAFPFALADENSRSQAIKFTDRLPYGQKPILYDSPQTDDPVSRLIQRLAAADVTLQYRPQHGFLHSLLQVLNVPIESQLLVFSKTAVSPHLVEPKNPRAVYFSDDVYVAWVPGAATIEIAAFDPAKGAIFYDLKQQLQGNPLIQRAQRCLACHAGTTTLQVPGSMVRSFLTDRRGKPVVGYSQITHETEISKRWGGWYVTGQHGKQTHRGNVSGENRIRQHSREPALGGNVTDLKSYFDVSKHLSPHSDIVAHLVLNHQVHGQNLLTRVNYEARLERRSDAEERLLRYLLFVDESPLIASVQGTSGFTGHFEKQGPRDSHGRSLRQFDLKSRLFKYRLSYLIQTRAFDGLPDDVKQRLYRRLWDVLTGKSRPPLSKNVPRQERDAIMDILRATQKQLPVYWMNRE